MGKKREEKKERKKWRRDRGKECIHGDGKRRQREDDKKR